MSATLGSIKTPYGTLWAPKEELVPGRILLADGSYPEKPEECAFMQEHIKPGMLCVDVGANCGMSSLVMARFAARAGFILAYEPNPDLQPALRRTLGAANRANDTYGFALPFAVGSSSGEVRMVHNPLGSGGNRIENTAGGTRVRQVTLDDDIHPHERPVGFLKIDAEGMDVDVLCGAVDILEKDRPVVMLEINMSAMRDLGKHPDLEIDTLHEIVRENGYEEIHIEGQNWGLVPR